MWDCRYYAICCQPLVYRHKMTPVRVAAMLSGCWLIPTFISFLPIMQSWNTIGIEDIVSRLRPSSESQEPPEVSAETVGDGKKFFVSNNMFDPLNKEVIP